MPKRKFTKAQEELAAKISNDISEDIDNGETRQELRMAVKWWANYACDQAMLAASLQSKVNMFKIAKSMMDMSLK